MTLHNTIINTVKQHKLSLVKTFQDLINGDVESRTMLECWQLPSIDANSNNSTTRHLCLDDIPIYPELLLTLVCVMWEE
ncbi:hypothetical protein Y032_1031g3445 [Ancylostoma ceylanicum]|uniref:Uncharacterized protein n=1 Tax=Ancylostoma ceylanicum TaxID=53326 RepID=A0A016W6W3_9BILA|nr:hypothetical protein Y032_1031g3445 [Ancylostoma ceylanicum]